MERGRWTTGLYGAVRLSEEKGAKTFWGLVLECGVASDNIVDFPPLPPLIINHPPIRSAVTAGSGRDYRAATYYRSPHVMPAHTKTERKKQPKKVKKTPKPKKRPKRSAQSEVTFASRMGWTVNLQNVELRGDLLPTV